MDSVPGEEKKKRSKALDIVLFVGASVLVAAVSTAAFWLADNRHVNAAWLFAAGAALIFFLAGTEIRIHSEERLLAERFQDSFIAYRARVPAYIPFVR